MESPFVVVPAIDVLGGRCVRLEEGRRERVTVEGGDPVKAVAAFAAAGAPYLHLVDLDGAFLGAASRGLVERVVAAARGVPVQVGGGYRSLDTVEEALDAGAARVVVGTAAASPAFVAAASERFGARVVVAVDARDGKVVVDGWTRKLPLAPSDLARMCAAAGARRLLVTATRRDGTLAGPDLALVEGVREASGLPVLAAGGVSSLDDLRRLREIGCEGAIVGSALWLGRFDLAEALGVAAAPL